MRGCNPISVLPNVDLPEPLSNQAENLILSNIQANTVYGVQRLIATDPKQLTGILF